MPEPTAPYMHLRNVLTSEDIGFITDACKRNLATEGMPCYALLEHLEAPAFLKIRSLVEEQTGKAWHYLNDFYIYTDRSSISNWHMDTELFTFENAINAWILLSPTEVDNPLSFIPHINDLPNRYFHTVKLEGDKAIFAEFRTAKREVRSLKAIDAERIHTPRVRVGDILLINPRHFHKTNVKKPKHSFAIKFVFGGNRGFLSGTQVSPLFWPEVAVFNRIIRETSRWDDVIAGLRRTLKTENGRQALSAGFYPENFELYKEKVQLL